MTVFLYPNRMKDTGLAVTRELIGLLLARGAAITMEDAFAAELPNAQIKFLPQAQAMAAAEIIITIGGDGTILAAAPLCLAADRPVLGINLGRTGFLAGCERQELPQKLDRLLAGEYQLEPHRLLHGVAAAQGWCFDAVNDIVFYGETRLHPMDYSVYCDDAFVCRYRSDGVVVATPTGSTAYALSAGGPILDTMAPVFEVNGICAHRLRAAPMVFSDERRLTIVAEAENRGNVYVCADSQHPCLLAPGVQVEISRAEKALQLISFGKAEQFEAIETKLLRS